MIKTAILFIILCFLSIATSAQYNFVVQNVNTSVFKTLDEAYANAEIGDTIYLPGGSFNLPAVEKSLTWIGVGYHPDSTDATNYTRINNAASFSGNCDNSTVCGIHFTSTVDIGSKDDDALAFVLFRCRINGNISLKSNDGNAPLLDSKIIECIADASIYAYQGSNIIIEKSIIRGSLYDFSDSYFDRVFFSLGNYNYNSGISYCFNGTQNCHIQNSIINSNKYFSWRIDYSGCNNNKFINSIFAGSINFPNGTNSGSNNLTSVPLVSLFDSIDGNIHDYSYSHNFHLKPGSPAIGAGTLGTDIGIFGGASPFKAGGLPSTPHIRTISIGEETSNGLLPVEIKVGAQNR